MQCFDCGTLIDGIADEPIDDARILVEDGTITAVGGQDELAVPEDADRVDHTDAVVIPGLIDAHLHLFGSRSVDPFTRVTEGHRDALRAARATADLEAIIEAGFTAVRDVGSSVAIGLRDAVEEGEIPGPRIYTSGPALSQTAGHGDAHYLPYKWVDDNDDLSSLADGPAECRKEARKRIREGVDLIKIMTTGGVMSEKDSPQQSQFTDAEIQAFTEEAHRVDIPVASHAQGAPGIKSALENGVDTIEHGFHLDDEALELMLETDATFVPTLSIMWRLTEYGEDYDVPEWGLRKANEAREHHFEAVDRAVEAGVPVAAGTDFLGPDLVPHGENALELELFVEECGFDEMAAIQSATSVAARTVADDQLGSIQPGKYADLVALGADPLENISAVREIETVYKGGQTVAE